MQIIVTARHCEIPDDVREHIDRQLERLSRFEPLASRAEVSVTEEKMSYRAEALVSVNRGERVHATADDGDMRSAVDQVTQKLEVQLRKGHDRRRDHRAPPPEVRFASPESEGGEKTEA